jgi:5-hydroxyisourate hydrolase-like protein (transthyretin family)
MPHLPSRFYPYLVLLAFVLLSRGNDALGQVADTRPKSNSSVTGRVTVGDKPAPGIMIVAGNLNQSIINGQATTDSDGRYRIGGLPAGSIGIAPAAPLYNLDNNSPLTGPGKVLTLNANETADGIDFKLTRGGVISGRVVDADNRPLIEERITLVPVDQNGAPARQAFGRYFSNYQMYQTDDRGIYRIYGLPAGRFKVSVGDDPGGTGGQRLAGYYQKTYYPDTPDVNKAAIVEITEGGEAKDVDITLGRRSTTYTVTGHIIDADTGKPLPGVSFGFGPLQNEQTQTYVAGFMTTGTPTNSLGEFRLEGVEPGHYAVFVSTRFDFSGTPTTSPTVFSDPVPFDVVDGDVNGVEIKAQQGLAISGVAVSDGISDRQALAKISNLRIGANVLATGGSIRSMVEPHMTTIAADGTFQITGLRPGKVTLFLMGVGGNAVPKGFSIARIERDGVPQPRGIELQPGENPSGIRVVLAYGGGVIRGQVKFEGGTLPSDALLFVTTAREGIPTRSGGQVDARGQFIIENLAAGTYDVTLQIISLNGKMQPGMPSSQKQTVTVAEGIDAQVTFTMTFAKKEGQ